MVHPSKIPDLVTDTGLEVMMAGYSAEAPVRDRIFQIKPIDPAGSEFGWRQTVVVGDNIPEETGYGQDAPQRTIQEGYTASGKQRKIQQSMDIPEEVWRSPTAEAKIRAMVLERFGDWGKGFQIKKERIAAAIFNRGTIAAGDTEVFSGTFPGNTDAHPGFCYDGKPLFAASGNGHPLYLASSTLKHNLVASAALTSTTLEAARVLMESTNAVDESGNPISIVANTLVVPPGLKQTAEVLIGSVQQPGTAQNDINTNRGKFDVVQWRYITDADAWFLGTAGKGLVFCDSGDPTIQVSEPNPMNGNVTVRMVSYCGAFAIDWRYWTAQNQATS